jgi:hypothetical protein
VETLPEAGEAGRHIAHAANSLEKATLGYRAKRVSIAKPRPLPGKGGAQREDSTLFFFGWRERSDFGFAQEAG